MRRRHIRNRGWYRMRRPGVEPVYRRGHPRAARSQRQQQGRQQRREGRVTAMRLARRTPRHRTVRAGRGGNKGRKREKNRCARERGVNALHGAFPWIAMDDPVTPRSPCSPESCFIPVPWIGALECRAAEPLATRGREPAPLGGCLQQGDADRESRDHRSREQGGKAGKRQPLPCGGRDIFAERTKASLNLRCGYHPAR